MMVAPASAGLANHHTLADAQAYLAQHPLRVMRAEQPVQPLTSLLDTLARQRVVYVGEIHDRYDHHLNQLAILQALHQKNPNLAIGVEWFQQPFQGAVNDFLAGRLDESGLLRGTDYYERWRYDYRMLRPVMEYARANGLPVLALNAPVELTRKVATGGLDALTPAERAQLPGRISPPDPAYRSRLEKIFAEHVGNDRTLENFMLVQRIWDETMASNITRFLQANPQWQMIVFSGAGHVSYGTGIPQDVAAHLPGVSQLTLASSDQRDVLPGMVDYFLLSQPLFLPPTGKLGVWLNTTRQGITIGEVIQNSAAQRAGLLKDDRLLDVQDQKVTSMADLMLTLARFQPGETVQVTVQRARNAAPLVYPVTLQ